MQLPFNDNVHSINEKYNTLTNTGLNARLRG